MKRMERNKTDEELEDLLETLDEGERHALRFGLLPEKKAPDDLNGRDVARLMRLNPEKSF